MCKKYFADILDLEEFHIRDDGTEQVEWMKACPKCKIKLQEEHLI